MTQLIGLCGSLRRASLNRKLLNHAVTAYGECHYREGDLDLPLYNGDVEAEGIPQKVIELAEAIRAADGIIISTPEYNKGISGVLKNALDWVSRVQGSPIAGKPVAIMTAAAGRTGGETAQYHTRHCLIALGADIIATPAICVATAAQEFDGAGALSNPRYAENVQELMDALRRKIAATAL